MNPPWFQPPMVPGVFHHPPQRVRSFPATPLPESHAEGFLNFFFVHVPPLQAAFWQRRSEPVKVLRIRSGRQAAPAATCDRTLLAPAVPQEP